MIKRKLESKLKYTAQKYPVVTVVGPRQSGKTVLVKSVFIDYEYVSLENIDMREFAKNDPHGFLRTYDKMTIFDEIQRVPELLSYIQTKVDNDNIPGQYILTGSQNFLLQESISQSLAGRTAILRLPPFSLEELESTKFSKMNLDEFIYTGFYPRIFDKELNPNEWYRNYIETYLEKDVRLLKRINDLSLFHKFLKLTAGRVGQILNLSSLAIEIGCSHNTVREWISVLETSFIIFLLQPYYKTFNKRVIKSPKIYFLDTGLVCALLGIENHQQLESHYLRGHLFENLVIAEILKSFYAINKDPRIYFWKNNTGYEIDCLIDSLKPIAIEIKSAETIHDNFFKNLKIFKELTAELNPLLYLIYSGETKQIRSDYNIIPWSEAGKIILEEN